MLKFSIITICCNEEKRILNTLKSIYTQTFHDYEHIIQDGCSTDDTLAVIDEAKDKYLSGQMKVYSEPDRGLYDAMNRALQKATGEYICFINSGDYLLDDRTLEKISYEIEQNPGMDWYYGSCIVTFPNGDEYLQIPTTIENTAGDDLFEFLRTEPLRLNHQTIFAHRSCFENNRFDTSYKLRAELKWYYTCMIRGAKIKALDFPVCKYSFGGLSERVSSVSIHAIETKRLLGELGLITGEIGQKLPKENDYGESYKNIYNVWLAIHQAGLSIAKYLKDNGVNKVAIYGYAELGTHLINELKNTEIEVVCVLDRQAKYPYSGVEVVHPEKFDAKVDMIIVTAVAHYQEIKEFMKVITNCKIESLETILEKVWYE